MSLGEYIRELMGGRATIVQTKTKAEGSTFVNAFLSEITTSKGVGPTVARAALASRTTRRRRQPRRQRGGPARRRCRRRSPSSARATSASSGSPATTIASRSRSSRSSTPGSSPRSRRTPASALLLVRSKESGAVVFGPNGTRFLDEDRVEGEDPTTLFGPHTIMSLKREDAMVHAPDLLLISQYDPELGEVAAFEELIGSHGGLGGPQTEPFILHPTEWQLDEEVPLGRPGRSTATSGAGWDRSGSSSGRSRPRRPPRRPQRRRTSGRGKRLPSPSRSG